MTWNRLPDDAESREEFVAGSLLAQRVYALDDPNGTPDYPRLRLTVHDGSHLYGEEGVKLVVSRKELQYDFWTEHCSLPRELLDEACEMLMGLMPPQLETVPVSEGKKRAKEIAR